jgi:hypothetical protein
LAKEQFDRAIADFDASIRIAPKDPLGIVMSPLGLPSVTFSRNH